MRPMPSSTRAWTRRTTSSPTLSWALCPHQVSTSVFASLSAVRPCSGSWSVAVDTLAAGRNLRSPSAMTTCMPSG